MMEDKKKHIRVSGQLQPSCTPATHNCQGTMSSKPKPPILPTYVTGKLTLVYPFSKEEYRKGIAALNNGKAAGLDNVLVEPLKNCGPT